ncbi:MAG: hypothetical protein AB1629_06795 [Candidatus Omnitrophota bacterium]
MEKKSNYNMRLILIRLIIGFVFFFSFFSLIPKFLKGDEIAVLNFLSYWQMAFPLLAILPIGMLIYLIFIAIKNVKLLAKILSIEASSYLLTIFFCKRITGNYKGRSVIVGKWLFQIRRFDYVIKLRLADKIKVPWYKSIRITDNTVLGTGEIWYIPRPFDWTGWKKWNIFIRHTEQDFIDIFEELTRAAEIVESQPIETFIKTTD